MRPLVAVTAASLLLLLAIAGPAAAAGPRDQVMVSGDVTVPANQTVDNVIVADGTVRIAGRATGDVFVANGPVTVTGRVDGSVTAVSGRVAVGPRGSIGGDLRYGEDRPRLARGAEVGGQISNEGWDQIARGDVAFAWRAAWWLAVTVSALVVALLMVWLAPGALRAAARVADTRLAPAVGWGLLVAVGLPALAVLALVTLVGIPLGIGLLLVLIPLYVAGYVTGGWLLGRRLIRDPQALLWPTLLGVVILRVLAAIPVVGGLVGAAATVTGLGALTLALWNARRRAAPAAAAPTGGPEMVR